MNKGLMSLRGYQTGGGVGDDWMDRLLRQLQKRWMNTKGKLYPHLTEMSDWQRGELGPDDIFKIDPDAINFWPTDVEAWKDLGVEVGDKQWPRVNRRTGSIFGGKPFKDAADKIIDLSNQEGGWEDLGDDKWARRMRRVEGPQAVPPLGDRPLRGVRPEDMVGDQLWHRYLGGLDPDELDDVLRNPYEPGSIQNAWYDAAPNLLDDIHSIDDLIYQSNPSAFDRPPMPLPPGPRAVPPRSGDPTLSEDLRGMGISDDDFYEEAMDVIDEAGSTERLEWEKIHGPMEDLTDIDRDPPRPTPPMSQADMQAAMISIREQEILDAALSGDISERRKLQELDKLMKLKEEIDYDANWPDIGSEGWQSIDEHGRPYNEFSRQRTGWSGPESWKKWQRRALDFIDPINPDFAKALRGVPWGSTVAPFLGAAAAAAGGPAALAAEQAIDFAITPTDIPKRGSQPKHTFMSQQEMDWEDVLSGDLDLQSYVDIHGTGPDIWDNPLGISPGAQTAKDKFLRQMRAGTSVNRYR